MNDGEHYSVMTTPDADDDLKNIDRGVRNKALKALLKLEQRPYKGTV